MRFLLVLKTKSYNKKKFQKYGADTCCIRGEKVGLLTLINFNYFQYHASLYFLTDLGRSVRSWEGPIYN